MVNKLNTILFLICIVTAPILYFYLPKQKVSQDEKRNLASFPELNFKNYVSGKWADSVDNFVDDNFPFRQDFIKMAVIAKTYKGFRLKNKEILFVPTKNNNLQQHHQGDTTRGKLNLLDDFDLSYNGTLIIIDGCVYPMGGGNTSMSKRFSKMVNEYAEELKGEVRVFSAVAPLSSAFMPVAKYAHYYGQNKRTLAAIGSSLSKDAYFCDVFDELDKHKDQRLFFKTDHHWKPIGAYYAYVAFCKAAGKEPVPLEEMDKKVKYNFLGSLYQKTLDPTVGANPDTMEYYVPKVASTAEYYGEYGFNNPKKSRVFYHSSSGGNTYSTFLGGDVPLMKINTTTKNGKKAVVIKNSMGNAFTPFLISHYEEIWVVDFRYSKQNLLEIIRKNGINDMIFAVGMYAAMSDGTINMMRRLGKQNGEYIPPKKVVVDTLKPANPIVEDTLK
ncbi:MAG: hypothetical protein FGM14_13480 [Flavobacteriales bacterium]|nr:hypothetical protein [Flavobacteriales bacterium]